MSENRSKYETYQFVALGSRLGQRIPIYQRLAGSDPETSLQIALINVMIDNKMMEDTPEIQLVLAVLNAKRQALFATSDKVNEISKMSMQLPSDEENDSVTRRDSDEVPEPPV